MRNTNTNHVTRWGKLATTLSGNFLATAIIGAVLTLGGCGGGSGAGFAEPDGSAHAPVSYSVGGTITGASASATLQLNGANNLNVTSGAFVFAEPLAQGGSYSVTVMTPPAGQVCTVANGSGTVAGSSITNVQVNCASPTSASLILSRDSTNLSNLPVGSTTTFTVTVTNQGTASAILGSLTASQMGIAAPLALLGTGTCASGATLNPGASCTLVFTYSPTSVAQASLAFDVPYTDSAGAQSAAFAVSASSQLVQFTNGQAASVVIGQTDFVSNGGNTTATTLYEPWGNPSVYNGTLFITDYDNNRILGYDPIPTSNGAAASFVIGQTDFTSYASGTTASKFNLPWASSTYAGILAVADASNNRVLLFEPIPSSTNPSASIVLGQTDFTSSSNSCTATTMDHPVSAVMGAGKLVVADYNNSRILIWNTIPTTSSVAPDLVLGQPDLTTCTANTGGVSATSMKYPGDVWTDGHLLIVADAGNNRLLIWNTFPTSNQQAANVVLGQTSFSGALANQGGSVSGSGFDTSTDYWSNVTSNGLQIFYSDYNNSRILIWNSIPTVNGTAADVVIGQSNFTSNNAPNPPTSSSLYGPGGITHYNNQFFVTDYGNNRVLVFNGQ